MTLFVLGAGGFAREVACVLDNSDNYYSQKEIYYVSDDENQWGEYLLKGKVVGSIENIRHCFLGIKVFIPAIGNPLLRKKLVDRAKEVNWKPFVSIIHDCTFIGDARIGDGSIICSMCSITTNVTIGKFVNVNLNCTIGHDVVIEDYVNLSPHCTISGNVHIEKYCDLGSAVTVLPKVTIGEGSVIGAGAVVTKDIPPYSLAVGIPAKVIKSLDNVNILECVKISNR